MLYNPSLSVDTSSTRDTLTGVGVEGGREGGGRKKESGRDDVKNRV